MARRNRIIYASQSVQAEGRVLYRVQTLGSSTSFDTTDLFELGQLNLIDIVEASPTVTVTLETADYGSIYTMATLAKIPVENLHHNIRQTDGTTFFGTVSGTDFSTGTISGALPVTSGTGKANIVIRGEDGNPLRYLHGVQLIDFARECGGSKGADIWSPVQAECSLGTSNDDIEVTQLLRDVFINNIELTYNTTDNASENYTGETEQKQWFLNDGRFLSWEEWRVGTSAGTISGSVLAAKTELALSLASPNVVATTEDGAIGFLKKDLLGRAAVLFSFVAEDNLEFPESKLVPVFSKTACTPTTVVEFFLYEASDNTLEYYENGLPTSIGNVLPLGRTGFQNGDKLTVFYAANAFALEVGEAGRPGAADSSYVLAKYFAPIGSEDVENVGALRQGQIEAYLVDPDLIFKQALTGATIGASGITFSNNVDSQIDLTSFVGLKARVIEGPGKNGPAREITAGTNSIVGNFNNGSLSLGGNAWSSLRLTEDSSQASTTSGVYVSNLCGVDSAYVGSAMTVVASGVPTNVTITSVDTVTKLIGFTPAAGNTVDDLSEVLVSAQPTTASTILVGDYELALRLQGVTVTADLTREQLSELGRLRAYARTITLPIPFTVSIDFTSGDLETFAKFSGKGNEFAAGTLTDLDIIDLLSKDNNVIVLMVYQQTDQEAGGTGLDRKVASPEMFGDEYFLNGVRQVYTTTDGSQTEYPLKTVVLQDLRVTDESVSITQGSNSTSTIAFRGTNSLSALRGYISVDLAIESIESQGG